MASFDTTVATPSTGPIVLYPRAHVVAKYIYNDGSEVTTGLMPSRASVTLRPHHQAGTCEVEFNATAVPFDLRRLNGVFLSVFLGAVGTSDGDVQDEKYLQFVGYADSESVKRSPDGTQVTMRARDLSGLLRDLKPMYQVRTDTGSVLDPTPRYSDTLLQAIQRILQWAKMDGVFEIRDDSGLGSTPLASLTNDRGVGGMIPIKHRDVSAWEAIEHAAAVCAVLVSVDLGKIVLRRPADAFALPEDPRTPPKYSFVFGEDRAGYTNAFELDVTKKFIRNRKGVRLIALAAGGRDVITADYPTDAQTPPKHAPKIGPTKQTKPRKVTLSVGGGVSNASSLNDPPRDVIAVGGDGVHSQEGLQKIAELYYRVRSRQELEGTLVTMVWDDKLFALRNGDRFEVRVKPELEADVLNQPDEGSQVAFLKKYFLVNDQAAKTMLAQIRGQESTLFYLRSICHEWSTDAARTTLDFISIVEV